MSLIAPIDEQEALESMLIDDAQRAAETQSGGLLDFRSLLRRLASPSDNASKKNPFNAQADNLRKHRDRLKGL